MMLCSKQIDEYLENQHNRTVCHTCVLKTVNRNMERGGSEIYIDFTRLYRARLRDYRTVQRYENNRTNHLPASPIAQVKNPQRSPLRLRFLTCTLEEAFCVSDSVIFERYTWSERRRSEKSIQISAPAASHIPIYIIKDAGMTNDTLKLILKTSSVCLKQSIISAEWQKRLRNVVS